MEEETPLPTLTPWATPSKAMCPCPPKKRSYRSDGSEPRILTGPCCSWVGSLCLRDQLCGLLRIPRGCSPRSGLVPPPHSCLWRGGEQKPKGGLVVSIPRGGRSNPLWLPGLTHIPQLSLCQNLSWLLPQLLKCPQFSLGC